MMLIDLPTLPVPAADNATLIAQLKDAAVRERRCRADFIVFLSEVEKRRLYADEGYSSLFVYLRDELKFSEGSSFRRMTAARMQVRLPAVASYLREGRLSLTKVCALRDVLAPDNYLSVLEQAASMTEKQVKAYAAVLCAPIKPMPKRRESITPIRVERQTEMFDASGEKSATTFTSEVLHRVTLTVPQEFVDLLDRLKATIYPNASSEKVFFECMKLAMKRKRADTDRPRKKIKPTAPDSRHIPAYVQRAVWERDGHQCSFVSDDGHRCEATSYLELHHRVPFARGGKPSIENMAVMCKTHNGLLARRDFGDAHMDRFC